MSASGPRRVWILGAGFSRSLGGPLLNDLFSMRKRAVFKGKYSSLFSDSEPMVDKAYALYHYGTGFPDGYLFEPGVEPPRGTKIWAHAEQYLEWLDDPANDAEFRSIWAQFQNVFEGYAIPRPRLITRVAQFTLPSREELAKAARQILATECHDFLTTVDRDKSERTLPYKAWGCQLDETDTIITFNYDLVVERIARTQKTIIVAGEGDSIQDDTSDSLGGRQPLLIKLHGSVTWQEELDDNGEITGFSPGDQPQIDQRFNPLIAAPGNRKSTLRDGAFKELWTLARERLQDATEVHVVGYGLPESDASARELLINSLLDNNALSTAGMPGMRIVLGDPGFRTARLERLLRTRIVRATIEPLYAQDYLQEYRRE